MKRHLSTVAALALLMPACSEDEAWYPPVDVSTEADAPVDLPDGAPDVTLDPPLDPAGDDGTSIDPATDGSDPGEEEATVPPVPTCLQRCGTSADCGNPATPAFSSDNYACTDGFCIYTGCLSDAECIDTSGAGFGCDTSTSPAYCQQTCGTASECGYPTMPAYTPDHYTCSGGYCRYTGCRSDAECVDTVGAGYGCNTTMSPAYCSETCATSGDCGTPGQPAYDSDNYDCTAGYCVYAGCRSDAECVDTLGAGYGCH